MTFDPKNWIDPQREAGMGASNVFLDILAESARVRARRHGVSQAWVDRRVSRVEDIKTQAAEYDSDACGDRNVRTFDEMVARWKQEG